MKSIKLLLVITIFMCNIYEVVSQEIVQPDIVKSIREGGGKNLSYTSVLPYGKKGFSITNKGNIFCIDLANRIVKFNQNFEFLGEIKNNLIPWEYFISGSDIRIYNNYIFIFTKTEISDNPFIVLDMEGNILNESKLPIDSYFSSIAAFTFSERFLYVPFSKNKFIQYDYINNVKKTIDKSEIPEDSNIWDNQYNKESFLKLNDIEQSMENIPLGRYKEKYNGFTINKYLGELNKLTYWYAKAKNEQNHTESFILLLGPNGIFKKVKIHYSLHNLKLFPNGDIYCIDLSFSGDDILGFDIYKFVNTWDLDAIRLWEEYQSRIFFNQIFSTSTLTEPANPNAYHPVKLFDRDPKTMWIEAAEGPGIGESVSFTFNKPVTADTIRFEPGCFWDKYWKQNYRIKEMQG